MSNTNSGKTATKPIIFISGRFRAGTSMLWNLFNRLPQYCAWYEPLHPNLLSHIQYVKPTVDHLSIDDYWLSYQQLQKLKRYYCASFGQHRLFLEKHEQWQELKNYINYLIKSSGDLTPVLQFNRMDLRLSWLKNTFPNATIIHIKREPYPLWISARKHIKTNDDKLNESYPDGYDLMQWSVDLAHTFPMLQNKNNRNSYFRHYFIWKLSQKMATAHADINLSLEDDFLYSLNGIFKLAKIFNWQQEATEIAESLVQKPQSLQLDLTKDNLYTDIELGINKIFQKTGLDQSFPSCPLNEIKLEYNKVWSQYPYHPETSIRELLTAIKFQKDEITALVN
ncbi:hypothetical protein MNBD_GAMMA01-1870 [hydrothermal vent metagenome]|uniref:Sulfotransferase n=1 Tax=hydrothermal vent metagenome TaxID=652676 RepID=A0A3B0UUN0_9ZZZZ